MKSTEVTIQPPILQETGKRNIVRHPGKLSNIRPGSSGSNKNVILTFLFLASSWFHLLIKQKTDVRVKIIPVAFFLFIGSSVKHLQRSTPHHEVNVCS